MTDACDLRPLIARLTRDVALDADGFRLPLPENSDGLATLLSEVEDAVLPAQLTFRNDRGQDLKVIATNQRLYMLLVIGPGPYSDADDLIGTPLDMSSGTVARVGPILHRFCRGSEGLRVRSHLQDSVDLVGSAGIPVTALKGQWAEAPPEAPRDTTARLAEVLAPVMDHATHWVMVENGALVGHSGNRPDPVLAESIERLRAHPPEAGQAAAPQLLTHFASTDTPCMTVFALADGWVFGARGVQVSHRALLQDWRRGAF